MKKILFLCVFLSGIVAYTHTTSAASISCNLYTSTDPVVSGYGAAYDVFSSARELLVSVSCDADNLEATLTVGKGDKDQYVYKKGYVYRAGAWEQISLTGDTQVSDWFQGSGIQQMTFTHSELDDVYYAVGYVCTWVNNRWNCGCENQGCAQGKWQLQAFKFEPSGGSTLSIINHAVTNITDTTATITWNLSQPSTGQVAYGLNDEYGNVTLKEENLLSEHIQEITGLTPGTTYFYRIHSTAGADTTVQETGSFTTTGGAGSSSGGVDQDSKRLIKHGWDIPTPDHFAENIRTMEEMPFDGVVIGSDSSANIQRQTPVSLGTLRNELLPVKNTQSTTLAHNFYMVYATPAGSFNQDYSVPVSNFKNVAQAAKEAGFKGVFFDTEEYFGDVWNYPSPGDSEWLSTPIRDACPGSTLSQCYDIARERGNEIMTAMIEAWPDIQIITSFGPWVSEPIIAEEVGEQIGINDVSHVVEVKGSFLIGMAEATVGTQAQYIDGGEMYALRSKEDFELAYDWIKNRLPNVSSLVPSSFTSQYADTVEIGFAIYDLPYFDQDMNATVLESVVEESMKRSDSYTWLYTEKYDWWDIGHPAQSVPQAWVDAVARGKSAGNDT